MAQAKNKATGQDRIRVVVPRNTGNPNDKTIEGVANGKVFRIQRGVAVDLTMQQYEVLRASGRVEMY